jgi:mannosyltransferase OCH1-like enzyme
MPIPRRVVQIWYQGAAAAGDARLEATRRHCARAGFEYALEDDASIRRQLPPEQLATYLAYARLHERVDYAKVCLLLARGGVYLDADATVVRPLDGPGSPLDFGSENLYVSRQHPALQALLRGRTRHFVNNGFYAAPPGHRALRGYAARLAALQRAGGGRPPRSIEATTGPLTLSEYLDGDRGGDVVLVPWRFLEACVGPFCDARDALVLHRHRLSWLPGWERALLQAAGAALVCWRAALALLAALAAALALLRL